MIDAKIQMECACGAINTRAKHIGGNEAIDEIDCDIGICFRCARVNKIVGTGYVPLPTDDYLNLSKEERDLIAFTVKSIKERTFDLGSETEQ